MAMVMRQVAAVITFQAGLRSRMILWRQVGSISCAFHPLMPLASIEVVAMAQSMSVSMHLLPPPPIHSLV